MAELSAKLEVRIMKLKFCACLSRKIMGKIAQLFCQHRRATVEYSCEIQEPELVLTPKCDDMW